MPRIFFASTGSPVRALLFGGFFGLLALSLTLPGFFVAKAAAQTTHYVSDQVELDTAMDAAIANDIIKFIADINSAVDLHKVNVPVVIDGNGHVLYGHGNSLLKAANNLISIENIAIRDSNKTGNGGAVEVNGSLTDGISNSSFTNNSAHRTTATSRDGYGGAVYVHMLSGGINNSTFSGNNASFYGGAMYIVSGLIGGVNNSTFTGNTAGGYGGAVYVGGKLAGGINGATFSGNNATDGGGGAVLVAGNLTNGISGSSFTGNNATGHGGAVFVYNDLLGGIKDSNFTGNNAEDGYGGAVNVGGDLSDGISGSTFSGNKADGLNVHGGALYVDGNLTGGISGSNFTNNTAGGQGGAVYVEGDLSDGIINSSFTENKADGNGGAVYVDGNLSDGIINSSFTGNKATNGGGAVHIGGNLSDGISGSNFTGNRATTIGGGAVSVGGNLANGISGSTFSGNIAGISGGAVNVNASLTGGISGSSFTKNTAAMHGGAVNVNASLTGGIKDSNFTGNRAFRGDGGAVYVGGNLANGISGSSFSGNTANGGGGAVYVAGDLSQGITGSNFTGNNSTGRYGGAVYVAGNLSQGITGSTFSGNTAGGYGGAVLVAGNLIQGISGSTFSNNTAKDGYGGAVYVARDLADGISGSSFTGNNASREGGAVRVFEKLSGGINASSFTGNTAGENGGAVVVGVALNGGINGSNFSDNTADKSGGAVYVFVDLNDGISGSTFSGNNATGNGGAVYVLGDLLGGISGSNFTGNKADESGGGVYVGGELMGAITDSSFVDNMAVNGRGGAIYLDNYADVNSSLTLTATSGQSTVFSGNRDVSGANSLYFAGGGSDAGNTTLLVSPAGTVDLRDPLRVAMNSTREKQVFTLLRDDSLASGGRFAWGGVNVLEADGGASVNLAAGRTDLAADFTLQGLNNKPLNLNIGAKHSLSLNFLERDPDLPVFDFTNADALSIINAPETHISATRSFISQSGSVLLIDADKLAAFNLTDANFLIEQNAAFSGKARLEDRKVWLDLDYHVSFNNQNTARALPALEQWLQNSRAGIALSDQQFNDLVMDLDSAAPEAAVSSAGQALSVSSAATSTALAQGLGNSVGQAYNGASFTSLAAGTVNSAVGGNMFRQANADRARLSGGRSLSFAGGANLNWKLPDNTPGIIDGWNPVNPQSKTRFLSAGLDRSIPTDDNAAPQSLGGYGPRLWAGYLGNFNHASKNRDYSGYDADTHGFLAGLTWEADRHWTFGAYAGYSHTDMDYDIHADLTADAGHFGLFSRYTTDYGLKIAADLGYSLISNDMKRSPDGTTRSKGSFDQDVWSLGLNFSYDIEPWQYGRITPFAGSSFTWLHQDAFNERGGDLDSHVSAVNYNNFSTVLGASIAHDFLLCDDSIVLTPSFTAAYRHDFGKTQMYASTNFLSPMVNNEAPISYSVKSRPTEPNAAILDVALDAMFKTDSDLQWGLKAAYGVELRGHSQDHSVFAGAEVRF